MPAACACHWQNCISTVFSKYFIITAADCCTVETFSLKPLNSSTDGRHAFHHTDDNVSGTTRSWLPEFEQTVLGVRADEVLMWVMNNTNHVFLVNLVNKYSVEKERCSTLVLMLSTTLATTRKPTLPTTLAQRTTNYSKALSTAHNSATPH